MPAEENKVIGFNELSTYDALIKNYIDQKLEELKEEILEEIQSSNGN